MLAPHTHYSLLRYILDKQPGALDRRWSSATVAEFFPTSLCRVFPHITVWAHLTQLISRSSHSSSHTQPCTNTQLISHSHNSSHTQLISHTTHLSHNSSHTHTTHTQLISCHTQLISCHTQLISHNSSLTHTTHTQLLSYRTQLISHTLISYTTPLMSHTTPPSHNSHTTHLSQLLPPTLISHDS